MEEKYNILKNEGFPVYKFFAGGGTRLYVGKYKDRQYAEKISQKIQNLGFETLIHTQKKQSQAQNTTAKTAELPKPVIQEQNRVKNIPFNQDITIKGIFGGHNIFFFVDKNWQLKDNCYLELIFSQSEIKKYKNSTLTVYLNDMPIKSISLQDKENYKEVEKIPLPKEQIIQGYNTVKFSTYHRITEEPCTDDLNPANWLVFHKESFIHLEYEETPDKIGINNYPYPYLKTSALEPVNCTILIPDKPTRGQITTAMIIAADFGRKVPYNNIDVKVMQYKDIDATVNTNLIIIGSSANRDSKLLEPVAGELSKIKNSAMIKEIASSKDMTKRILYLLSDKDAKLITAAKMLTQDKLVSQMKGDTQFVSTYTEARVNKNSPTQTTLKDLGYGDTVIKGIFHQQATYVVNIPQNLRLKGEPFIKIPFRYSSALDFDKSSVSIYLNGIPVADKLLQQDKSSADEITVNIPEEFWEEKSLELKLLFYLEPHGFDCTNWRHGDIWAFVSNNTSFNIPHEIVENRYFENYPGLFIKNGTFDDILLILPEEINERYLTMAANTVAFIGHSINKIENLTVVQSPNLKNADKNLIIFGTPQDNSLIRNLNDQLHIKFDKNFESFKANDKMYFVNDYSRDLSSIQLLPSPFNAKKHMMVITGTTEKNLMPAEIYLKNLEFNRRLSGDGVVIDTDGDIQSAYFVKPKDIKDERHSPQDYMAKWHENPQFVMYIVFFIMIIIIGIYGIIIATRGRRK